MLTKMRSTKGHELTRNAVSVVLCDARGSYLVDKLFAARTALLPKRSTSGEKRVFINKAKPIAPGICDVEGAFTPRAHHDFAGTGAVNVV